MWSLGLREEHGLRVTDNGLLRRIFQPNRGEATGGRRKLQVQELHNLYSSPDTVLSQDCSFFTSFVMRHYRGPPGSGLTMMNTMEKCQETAWGQQGGKGLPYKQRKVTNILILTKQQRIK
jgi:hypothetical protein